MNTYTLAQKKELGAYYTPPELTDIMTDWAIRSSTDSVLEPSFGGCGFLESSIRRLKELGSKDVLQNLHGADLDINAFTFLKSKLNISKVSGKFLHGDFITISPEHFRQKKFDVVIGNPPYISMHNMSSHQKSSCFSILKSSAFNDKSLGRNASLWAFFLLHSLSFIKENGRCAWVLPSSLLHANYAKKIIEIYKKHFKKIRIIKINERVFRHEGADEVPVIFICDEFSSSPIINSNFSISVSNNLVDFKGWMFENDTFQAKVGNDNFKIEFIEDGARRLLLSLGASENSIKIGRICDVKIGMVTGKNNFFMMNKETASKESLSKDLFKYAIGRFSDLNGIVYSHKDNIKNLEKNKKVLLLNPTEEMLAGKNSPIRNYLSKIGVRERIKNRTFKKRKNWYKPDDLLYPDAFLTYMIHNGPRLVINDAKINCTNSIHRIFFKKRISKMMKIAICISFYSSYSQLWGEIVGRSYGSGVLKIEPTAAKDIHIIINDSLANSFYSIKKDIEKLHENNKIREITDLVDRILIEEGIISLNECMELQESLSKLRMDRYKGVKNNAQY